MSYKRPSLDRDRIYRRMKTAKRARTNWMRMFKQSREVRALRRLQGTSECSVIHPRGHPSSSHAGSKAQSSAAHGKIADKIPHQRHKLHNGRKEGQDSGMEPDGKVNRHHDGTEVSCGEGQSRARHQVHGILVRAHQDSPGCDEKHRANRPQNRKLSWFQRQHGKQCEADHEACQCGKIASPKDEETVPAA